MSLAAHRRQSSRRARDRRASLVVRALLRRRTAAHLPTARPLLRLAGLALGLAWATAGCGRDDQAAAATPDRGRTRDPAEEGGAVPGAAIASVERFLALSTFDAAPAPGEREALLGCDMGEEPFLPSELLASYQISGRFMRGDTAVVRARVVTVAEQDRSRTDPGRFTASQRVRRGEWEWDVVREDGGWRLCAGPTFGLVAPDSLTTWRPSSASAATARELGATVRERPAP